MIYTVLIAFTLVLVSVLIHLVALRTVYAHLDTHTHHPAIRVGLAVYVVIFAHCLEIIIFAAGFYISVEYAELGQLKGEFAGDFREYIYFSLVSYTSLGLGDVYPYGPIRLITGIEALTGLMMIGWSASFTYLCMFKVWGGESGSS